MANLLVFDWEVINHGGHYDPTTGIYTVPYDGMYQFHAQMTDNALVAIRIYVDENDDESHADQYSHEGFRSATVILDLQATNGSTNGSRRRRCKRSIR